MADVSPFDANDKKIELRGAGSNFPVAVAVVKLDAYSVAKTIYPGRNYTFSLDHVKLCERLRQLAALIEAHEILPQSVSFTSKALVDDYTLTTLEFSFAEKVEQDKQ